VFKAEDGKKAGLIVALKVYHPEQMEERSAREVRALKVIRGETIVSLQGSGTITIRGEKCPYVATTY
jgi:formylmethanofuran dehydrogenase subunit C